jgi:hypothetical protein
MDIAYTDPPPLDQGLTVALILGALLPGCSWSSGRI